MTKLFISHSSQDDAFVRDLQQALGDLKQDVWIDSRELRGGDPLWSDIQKGVDDASGYAVVVSPDSLQSKWVNKELTHALALQKERGRADFPVIPLSLNGTKLGVLEEFFGEEPLYITVSSSAGGVDAALNAILVALGKRLPADVTPEPQPKAEPLEELVLELTDLKFHEQDGVRRASARARLVHEPGTPGKREVASEQSWRFIAPIGPIEAEELRWYLEKYIIWPSEDLRERARKVEESLPKWGQLLRKAAIPEAFTTKVMQDWSRIGNHADRRFSVQVDATLEAGASAENLSSAREAATLLLSLPWELLHDGDSFIFQGAKPIGVRRRLPNTRVLDVALVSTPIRILLITARPEDDACNFIDHRVAARPLIDAMEDLGNLVHIHLLSPPTLPALREELDRAREPYHVVHFDGHGIYDSNVGLGALCFEDPRDIGLLGQRRHIPVTTSQLAPVLRDYRIPLVFLGAFPSLAAKEELGSIASELLELGTVSVATMSHNVPVETLKHFVQAFYQELAQGRRVGDGMLRGQRELKDDPLRGRVFGAGELRLEDWFVPVLFQEKDDPILFSTAGTSQTRENAKTSLAARFGELPAEPETGFIGHSRELLALQRLLCREGNGRYAVIRGQGGEGKTALAAEFARWMVRSQQIRRAAFASVETSGNAAAVLDAIGGQLVTGYSVTTFKDLEQAILPVERALTEQATLLVIDNMESILLPPYINTPEALSEEAPQELEAILKLCARLNAKGDTRLIFTSREALPAPFDAERNRRELHQLDREDAVKLVERVLNQEGVGAGAAADAPRDAIEALVDTVHAHARTLALLAPSLRSRGVEATRASLIELMTEMERKFPDSREKSVFASVELSLRRMSRANRDKARVLGVFNGRVDLDVLRTMTGWERDVDSLAAELIETGLATRDPYDHLTLNPALSPYLSREIGTEERESLTARWAEAMRQYANFLRKQQDQRPEIASTLTMLELPNLFALLDHVQSAGDPEATIDLATSLYDLLQYLDKPRLLERLAQVRDASAASLGHTWNHAQFEAHRTRIEQQLGEKRLRDALDGAQELLRRARLAGETAYEYADYDLSMACFLVARALETAGAPERALPLLDEAQKRFETIERDRPSRPVERMASACDETRGDCLVALGQLDEAADIYKRSIRHAEKRGDDRSAAVVRAQLASVRRQQGRFEEALQAYEEAREQFTHLNEQSTVATTWYQTGEVYEAAKQAELAEDAYRKALAINIRVGNIAGQATTLNQLGNLYEYAMDRPEAAVAFYRQATDRYEEIQDEIGEGVTTTNLGVALRRLGHFDEARQEIRRAIEHQQKFGHASEPWKTWAILADIETAAGNLTAASEATHRATEHYVTYRRDGGENHNPVGRLSVAVTQALLQGDVANATTLLNQLAADSDLPSHARTFIEALKAIVAGSRDRTLADDPELDYSMSAEILLLIETLEKHDHPS